MKPSSCWFLWFMVRFGISEYIKFVCVRTRPKHFQFYFVIIYFISFYFFFSRARLYLAQCCLQTREICTILRKSDIYFNSLWIGCFYIYWMLYCTVYTIVLYSVRGTIMALQHVSEKVNSDEMMMYASHERKRANDTQYTRLNTHTRAYESWKYGFCWG